MALTKAHNRMIEGAPVSVKDYGAVDIATISATNAPAWGSSGYAHIEVLDQWFGVNDKSIRVTKDNATATSSVFFTQGGGTPTWGTIK
jgi:hypothetical protein